MKIKVEYIDDDSGYYPFEVIIPRTDLTLTEAKELLAKLQTEIDIAEWREASKSRSAVTGRPRCFRC